MRKNQALLLFLLLFTPTLINNQPAVAVADNTWSHSYNGPYAETGAYGFVQTSDGGYVILASTGESFSSEKSCWLLGINAHGAIKWNKTIPLARGAYDSVLTSIITTADGGFALAGAKDFSSVTNNIYSLNGKGLDFWLVKTDKVGDIEWNQTYGGSWHEAASAIVSTTDGGYALAGYTWSFTPNGYWLVRTDSNGTLQWSKSYESNYGASDLVQTADGGFALVGTADSQVKVVKVDAHGSEEWNISLGGLLDYEQNEARSIVKTDDGGYVVLGYAFKGYYEVVDSWLSKVNSTGNQEWFRTFDGNFPSLAKVSSGGFVLAGSSNSSNCLVKTDALGETQWAKPLGNSTSSSVRSVIQTANGFAVAGTFDNFANVSKVWVMRTDVNGNAPQNFSDPPALGAATNVSTTNTNSFIATVLVVAIGIAAISLLLYRRHRRTANLNQ